MLKFPWAKAKNNIEVIKTYYAPNSPWEGDAVLFFLHEGKGSLRQAYGEANDRTYKMFLLLNETPLIKWHSDDSYWCPTCQKLVSAGYGIDNTDKDMINQLRLNINQPFESILKSLDDLKPIIGLLESGYYVLADLELFPSNGNGKFFWTINNKPSRYQGTCDTLYKYNYSSGTPKYVLPTETPNNYSSSQTQFYLEERNNATQYRAIAYYLENYMSALLDGHHKATAAAIKGSTFKCLTLMPVSAYSQGNKKNKPYFYIGGVEVFCYSLPENLNRYAIANFDHNRLTSTEVEYYLNIENTIWDDYQWDEDIIKLCTNYADILGLAAVKWAGDLSDERINNLVNNNEKGSEDKLELILRALITLKDPRSKDLALTIAKTD